MALSLWVCETLTILRYKNLQIICLGVCDESVHIESIMKENEVMT